MKKTALFSFFLLSSLSIFAEDYQYDKLCKGSEGNCRPPQFVHMAFDGCQPVSMWWKTRSFAKEYGVDFTYFVSGVYLLTKNDRDDFSSLNYVSPTLGAGKSRIGFAESKKDITDRYRHMALAHRDGHEIASHGMGHFYGGAPNRWTEKNEGSARPQDWNVEEWKSELSQTKKFLTRGYFLLPDILKGLGLPEPSQVGQSILAGIIGFRAPQLSVNDSLRPALRESGHKYDTSMQSGSRVWPSKDKNGIWNFPLALIPVQGVKGNVTAMDYNMEAKKISAQTAIDAYVAHFMKSYKSNRAPVHFGHHFTAYGGKIKGDPKYWYVLKEVTKRICHLPEVRCTSFRNLEKFLSTTPLQEIKRFSRGKFPKN
jgi:hypothetical protein